MNGRPDLAVQVVWINLLKSREGLVPYHTQQDCVTRSGKHKSVRIPTARQWIAEQPPGIFKQCDRCRMREQEVAFSQLPLGSIERKRAANRQKRRRLRAIARAHTGEAVTA